MHGFCFFLVFPIAYIVFKVEWGSGDDATETLIALARLGRSIKSNGDEKDAYAIGDDIGIPDELKNLPQNYDPGYCKLIGYCNCVGSGLINGHNGAVSCGNMTIAIEIGKQLIANGQCAGFVVDASGNLYPKSAMARISDPGRYYYSYINVSEDPNNYVFHVGENYDSSTDIPPITICNKTYTMPLDKNEANQALSLNDVLVDLESNKFCTNVALFLHDDRNSDPKSYERYKQKDKIPGSFNPSSPKTATPSSLPGGLMRTVFIKYDPNTSN